MLRLSPFRPRLFGDGFRFHSDSQRDLRECKIFSIVEVSEISRRSVHSDLTAVTVRSDISEISGLWGSVVATGE
jgi:hypothetical protein